MAAKDDVRAYFKMDVGYLSNPKVADVLEEHPRAVILHMECIAYSAQHLTNGVVPVRLAMRFACATQSDLDACTNAGLLRMVNGTHVEVHDYLKHQRSAESVKGQSEQAKRAAQARWEAKNDDAERMPTALPTAMQREKEREKEDSCSSTDVESDFADWYAGYPRKVGKGQALRAYRSARKKTDASTLSAAVLEQTPTLMAKGKEFCPHPASWLNGERWEDEPSTPAPGAIPATVAPANHWGTYD